jgi:hypothetical protein
VGILTTRTLGDFIWFRLIDPLLRFVANDELTFLRRARGFIQILLLIAILLLPISAFYSTAHMVLASGLLFDIAGILRLFLFEEIRAALNGYRDRESLPSVAMRGGVPIPTPLSQVEVVQGKSYI